MGAQPGLFALIGAGPSLDYCAAVIDELIGRQAHFFISDSVAAGFLTRWQPGRVSVLTVEMRRHGYLRRISRSSEFSVLAYQKANSRNLRFTVPRVVSQFRLVGESGNLPALYSPGTVLGTMLSCALALATNYSGSELHLLGADLFYIDNQVYSRLIDLHTPLTNRLESRELWQYEMVLKKSSQVTARNGFAIRTSFEFLQTRENLRNFIGQAPGNVRIIEYSPLGLDSPRVEKRIPAHS